MAEIICHLQRFSKLYKVVIREKEIQFVKGIEREKFEIEEGKRLTKLFKAFFYQNPKTDELKNKHCAQQMLKRMQVFVNVESFKQLIYIYTGKQLNNNILLNQSQSQPSKEYQRLGVL